MTAKADDSSKKRKMLRADCSHCRGERNCGIKGKFVQSGGNDDYSWHVEWYILQCRGCDHVFSYTISTNSEDYTNFYECDGSTGTVYNEAKNYWPALSKRSYPEWISDAGIDAENVERLDEALLELYKALNNDLYMLAGIGIRTSFDVAASLLEIDDQLTFKAKLEALQVKGKIGQQDKARLMSLVEAGNASAHRGWKPSAKDLDTMMDVLEDFVYETFVSPARKARVDAKLAKMGQAVPRRGDKKPS